MHKRVAKKAIKNAETIQEILSEAYAKRGHRAIDCALNKILTLDIIKQRRVPATLCCNDAKQCYDRILHAIANICLQRVGVCPKTCLVMLGTLQQMQHHIKTAYGVSKDSYGCVQTPLQGVLQGNGAGPAIWMLISIPLINMLHTQGFGFKSTNILSGEEYQFACYTYVDNTDLIHKGDSNTTPQNIFDGMQNMLNHWEGGLRATGGALVPETKLLVRHRLQLGPYKLHMAVQNDRRTPGPTPPQESQTRMGNSDKTQSHQHTRNTRRLCWN
jgi:hypothetical protein